VSDHGGKSQNAGLRWMDEAQNFLTVPYVGSGFHLRFVRLPA